MKEVSCEKDYRTTSPWGGTFSSTPVEYPNSACPITYTELCSLYHVPPDRHSLTVDIRELQVKGFADPQTRRIDRHQDRPMFEVLDGSKKSLHLPLRENDRKSPPRLPLGNSEPLPIPLERRLIKKLQCPIGLSDRSLRNVSLLDEIMKILSAL